MIRYKGYRIWYSFYEVFKKLSVLPVLAGDDKILCNHRGLFFDFIIENTQVEMMCLIVVAC